MLYKATWVNEPKKYKIQMDKVVIQTEPDTDFWQGSYYGFCNDNAPALLLESDKNFTFSAKIDFNYEKLFDQCGLIIYIDSKNWFKALIEFENQDYAKLGSVVTNFGYSDWAATEIKPTEVIWYRLSRRVSDFS